MYKKCMWFVLALDDDHDGNASNDDNDYDDHNCDDDDIDYLNAHSADLCDARTYLFWNMVVSSTLDLWPPQDYINIYS